MVAPSDTGIEPPDHSVLRGWRLRARPDDDDVAGIAVWRQDAIALGLNPETLLPLTVEEEAALEGVEKFMRERIRTNFSSENARWRRHFLVHGDPRKPWLALCYARAHNLPVPEWVMEYLEYSSMNILEQHGSDAPELPFSAAESVGRILGFSAQGRGATDPIRQAEMLNKYEKIAQYVEELVEDDGNKLYMAQEKATFTFDASLSTVRRACEWYEGAKSLF